MNIGIGEIANQLRKEGLDIPCYGCGRLTSPYLYCTGCERIVCTACYGTEAHVNRCWYPRAVLGSRPEDKGVGK